MPDYQRMYTTLFNAVTDAVSCIQQGNSDRAEELLIQAQQKTEELYITSLPEGA